MSSESGRYRGYQGYNKKTVKSMIVIQSKTGELRDKIRDECGSRGKAWFDKIQKNKK